LIYNAICQTAWTYNVCVAYSCLSGLCHTLVVDQSAHYSLQYT